MGHHLRGAQHFATPSIHAAPPPSSPRPPHPPHTPSSIRALGSSIGRYSCTSTTHRAAPSSSRHSSPRRTSTRSRRPVRVFSATSPPPLYFPVSSPPRVAQLHHPPACAT